MTEHSIVKQLEVQNKEIADRIKFAFDHKKILSPATAEVQIDRSLASKVDIDEAKAFTEEVREQIKQQIDPQDILLQASSNYEDNQVRVEDSHLYPFLVKEVFKRAIVETGVILPDSWVEGKIKGMLDHEYLHAVPALAQEGLSITYGISVFKDNISGGISLQPYIGLNGVLSLLLHKDIVSNPDNATYSAKDKRSLEWTNDRN